jgi:hypothetical protein
MPLQRSVLAATALLALAGAVHAHDLYPWRQHEAPFPFLFGNEFDSHQQSRRTRDGGLFGFLYVRFTGTTTRDRYPVASHADCDRVEDCVVGWTMAGAPVQSRFLYQVGEDHPVFLLARADFTQPGSPSHFHWVDALPPPSQPARGYLLQLTAVDRFCFVHHGAASAGLSCRENGGVPVDPGTDVATHLNVVASAPPGF